MTADTKPGHTDNRTFNSQLFPAYVIQAAQKSELETGCLASVALAQWAQESGFGKYQLHANNPFGMKWYQGCPFGFVTVMTKEWEVDHFINIEAKFIAFPSLTEAFLAHGKLLMNPNGPYKSALPNKDNWQVFVPAFAHIYATDPHYAQALTNLIKTYHLDSFDNCNKEK